MPDPPGSSPEQPARRLELLEPFLAMEVMERAAAMEREGARVMHLELGEPDFAPPEAVVEACVRAVRSGETRYTDSRGMLELREAIAADCERRFGVRPDPDRVLVTSGTSPAMLLVFSLLVNPGDEVILAAPHYPCYPNFIRYCGGVPVVVPTLAAEGFALDPRAVAEAITSRTRAIVTSSPANPSGAIQSRETLEALAALGPPLISDEIYDGLVYDGARATSALEISERAFVLDGFSKRYAMTGFRLGYLIAPDWARRPLQIMQQNLFISANHFVQRAGIAALEHGGPHVERMRVAYEARRDRLVDGLRALGFGVPHRPPGAFYVLADASRFDTDSRRLAFALLERAQVGATPGIDFGPEAEGMLRFTFAVGEDTIDTALARLSEALPAIEADEPYGTDSADPTHATEERA
jgi:aspartate/methionine/tyrosine aminotransferase